MAACWLLFEVPSYKRQWKFSNPARPPSTPTLRATQALTLSQILSLEENVMATRSPAAFPQNIIEMANLEWFRICSVYLHPSWRGLFWPLDCLSDWFCHISKCSQVAPPPTPSPLGQKNCSPPSETGPPVSSSSSWLSLLVASDMT